MSWVLCALSLTKSLDLPHLFFPLSIMYKLHGLASIKEGVIVSDHDGYLELDSSHFLRLGPGLAEVHVGYWRTT
jgi:hypothetical protein